MSRYETLNYAVLSKEGPFEIRRYSSFYVVEYRGMAEGDMNASFNQLFRYISSENLENRKISMTTPVLEEMSGTKKTMAFVMPKALGDDIPQPLNENLKVQHHEAGEYAVITFSGLPRPKIIDRNLAKLRAWMGQKGLAEVSNVIQAYYNPPLTPPFLRRNEIMIKVGK